MSLSFNGVFMAPNRLDTTFYTSTPVVLSGGKWISGTLANLKDPVLASKARSQDATTASTWFDVDLGVQRDILGGACPGGNVSRNGSARLRGSTHPAWSSCTASAAAIGAGVVTFHTVGDTVIAGGSAFTFGADPNVYTVTADVAIAAGASAAVAFSPVLVAAVTAGAAIVCHTPDLSAGNVVFDSGWIDWWRVIYEFGTLPFGHPSFFDGKMTDEQAQTGGCPIPWLTLADSIVSAGYWRFEISDVSNPDGYVELPRFFLTPGWQASINFDKGAQLGWEIGTTVVTSLGGVDFFNVQDGRRVANITYTAMDEDEAMEWPFDLQALLGTDQQVFFVYNPWDSVHLHRRALTVTIRQPSPLAIGDGVNLTLQLAEVLGA